MGTWCFEDTQTWGRCMGPDGHEDMDVGASGPPERVTGLPDLDGCPATLGTECGMGMIEYPVQLVPGVVWGSTEGDLLLCSGLHSPHICSQVVQGEDVLQAEASAPLV